MYNHHLIDIEFETSDPCKEMIMFRDTILDLCKESGVTVMNEYFHQFKEHGQGFTGVVCLAESHVSVHTWPEYNKMAVDIFICNLEQEDMFLEMFKQAFGEEKFRLNTIERL